MAETDDRALEYGRPGGSKQPAAPVRDSTLLLVSCILLFGPPMVLAALAARDVGEMGAFAGMVMVIAWALGSVAMVVVTKRRLHPSSVPSDRPNRVILAFACSGLSLLTFLCLVGSGVVKARHSFRQMRCHENLRSIGIGIVVYMDNNQGSLPPDLVTLLGQKILTAAELRCGEMPAMSPPAITAATTDQDLIEAGVTPYIYLGDASMHLSGMRNAFIVPLVIELPGNHSSGLVLFADGHNEARTPQDVAAILSLHLARQRGPTTAPSTSSTR